MLLPYLHKRFLLLHQCNVWRVLTVL